MIVSHNLLAMNANRMLGVTGAQQSKNTEKLSSGYRINRSADDAAGLAISEKMRRQIRGLTQASSNAQDGISMVQVAEGGLNEVHDMLQRMNELAVKAANGTLTEDDRQYVDSEIQNLKKEINRVAGSTTFNEIQLFPDDGSSIIATQYDIHLNADGTYTSRQLSDAFSFTENNISDNATATATYLAGTLLPQAFSDITSKLPALKSDQGDLDVKLDLAYIDGANGTLAYAQYSYYLGSYDAVKGSFSIKVDTADFTDENSLSGGNRNELLKSTIYHELTHSIMQYTLTKGMATEYPGWFTEGAAQVVGGGFATGWNTSLAYLTDGLTDQNDTSKDAEIKQYLQSDTVANRPYGHGYLAVAYAAQLASGSDVVNADNLAKGLNSIFEELRNGATLEAALQAKTGKTMSQLTGEINNGSDAAVEFVRKLSVQTGNGAGSVVFGALNQGSQILGAPPSNASTSSSAVAATSVNLQVGAEPNQVIELQLFSIGTKTLGLEYTNTTTDADAGNALNQIKNAIGVISGIRSYYGAIQNRLEHTRNNLNNVVENTTSAESTIRDTDMSKMMVDYSNTQVLLQAGQAMLAQANQSKQGILSLLQ